MFTFTLVTPEKRLVSGQEIEEVFIPAYRGEINVLPGHAPLMTTLKPGALRYRLKGETQMRYVAVSSGYCQVNPFGVNVLAETAETPEELDVARIDAALKSGESSLMTESLDAEATELVREKLDRARARREVVAHIGSGR